MSKIKCCVQHLCSQGLEGTSTGKAQLIELLNKVLERLDNVPKRPLDAIRVVLDASQPSRPMTWFILPVATRSTCAAISA